MYLGPSVLAFACYEAQHFPADTGNLFGVPLARVRNAPPLKRDENGQVAEIRLPAKKTIALSFITVVLCVVAGNFLGGFAALWFGQYYLLQESYTVIVINNMCSIIVDL